MKWVAVCFGVAALSGSTFLGLYVFRDALYATIEVEPATLAELYPVSSTATAVTGYRTEVGPFLVPQLRKADRCTGWRVETDGGPVVEANGDLRIPVRQGIHDYVVHPYGCSITEPARDELRFNLFFGKASSFGAQDLARDQYQVNSVNLPTVLSDPAPFSRWVPDVAAVLPEEAAAAHKMLGAEGFDPTAPTRKKIEFLAAFVRRHMPSGSPPPYLNTISPWQVFLEGNREGAGSFCFQWSLAYGYLANAVGIPTRNLFTGGAMDEVDMGSHAFSESYIREEARWAYVDPTNDIAYVTNPAGDVLTGADLYMAVVTKTDAPLTARVLTKEGMGSVPFPDVAANVRYFMHRDSFLIYIGSHDGRYQLRGSGMTRYGKMLYRFLFQPQQYFGYTHFVSYPWVRAAAFFVFLTAGAAAVVLGAAGVLRRRRG